MSNKLLIFSYDFPPSNGGVARLCKEIAIGMCSHYKEVTIITRKKEKRSESLKNIEIIELPSSRFKCEIQAYIHLSKINDKENVDIICGLWHPEATLALIAGFKNVFVLGHGTEFLHGNAFFRKYFWLPIYAKCILKKSKLVIANSLYTNNLVKAVDLNIKVITLPLGVNETFFKPYEKPKEDKIIKIASLSRVEKFKGYDFIAKSIASLPENYKNKIYWNIGGIGPYLEELKILVKTLKIEEHVFFHGFVKEENLPAFYNSNDLFVLCTREQTNSIQVEGFGLVFLEAQSCGLPVIGVNSGGIQDAIEHENGGWLIKQDDEKSFHTILKIIMDDSTILKTQSINARKRIIEKCTWIDYNMNLKKILSK
jgi:phosphatidyl-myo-inositol dimannoside synthase